MTPVTSPAVVTGAIRLCRCDLGRSCLLPFDVVCVPSVVSLQPLVHVEQDDHGGDEIHRFSSGEQVKVGATVPAAITVAEQGNGQGIEEQQNPDGSAMHFVLLRLRGCVFTLV